MFKKVLISDDLGSINKGVLSVLKDLGVPEVEEVHYCDDAYLRIQPAGGSATTSGSGTFGEGFLNHRRYR